MAESEIIKKLRNQEVGIRLRTARETAGLTQDELADKLGVQNVSVSRWETGEHGVSHNMRAKLLEILNLDRKFFLPRGGESVNDHEDVEKLKLLVRSLRAENKFFRELIGTTSHDVIRALRSFKSESILEFLRKLATMEEQNRSGLFRLVEQLASRDDGVFFDNPPHFKNKHK